MKSAAFHNTIVVFDSDCDVYNSTHVCLPGHRVPRQFKFRTKASSSSITIEFPHPSKYFGLIFSVVVSSSYRMKEYHNAYIQCQYYSKDGSQKFSICPIMRNREITNLSLDHIFLWLSPLSCVFDNKTVFEFCVITDSWEHDDAYSLEECGICPIYYSELPTIAASVNLSRDLESVIASELSEMFGSDLNESMQFESESIERYVDHDDNERELGNEIDESIEICDEKESTCIQKNQQDSDLNEKCSYSSYDSLMDQFVKTDVQNVAEIWILVTVTTFSFPW
ncbi:hypothetical protein TSUD_357180 [Trifolium subterraneum]|uniref:Uncharacterized protein n=1 Tax=Trifolium subterraneum TaxID=3900 RepID=A0A2Z6NQQ7_TRISU|nr:hypothetical protein TSUD_357180 [Trifolium subterraneum]